MPLHPSAQRHRGTRAVGYARRSTDRQEQSIGDQQESIEKYAADHNLKLLRFYIDDAISGTSTEGRAGFLKLIEDAQRRAREFDIVIVYDVKRFGRIDNDEAGYYRHMLRTHGVEVQYVSENFTGDRTDDLLRPVKQWQAREESKDLSKVTIRGLLSKAQNSNGAWMGGVPPWGYDLKYESAAGNFICRVRYMPDGSKQVRDESGSLQRMLAKGETLAVTKKDLCRLVISDSARVENIRRIYQLYTEENRGFKGIADALNREGVGSPRNSGWHSNYNGMWSMSTIRAILTNQCYVGDLVWNRRTDARFHRIEAGNAIERDRYASSRLDLNEQSDWVVVEKAHEPIVTRRVFELAKHMREQQEFSRLQRRINPRTGEPAGTSERNRSDWVGPKAKYLLSGLITCARCGSRYEGYTLRLKQKDEYGKTRKILGYACGGYIRKGRSVCQLGRVDKDVLESAVIDAVLKHYEPLSGKDAPRRIAKIIQSEIGEEINQVAIRQAELEKRLKQIDRLIRNLVDNITRTNREIVDKRIEELTSEREKVEARLDSTRHLAVTETESKEMIRLIATFIRNLSDELVEIPLSQRQALLRKCIESATFNHDQELIGLQLHRLPLVESGVAEVGCANVAVGVAKVRSTPKNVLPAAPSENRSRHH